MKLKNRGFSAIELVMILLVLAIVSGFVYFVSRTKTTDKTNVYKSSDSSAIVQDQNNQKQPSLADLNDNDFVVNSVKQIATEAEIRFAVDYSSTFLKSSNSVNINGSGILQSPGSLGAKVFDSLNERGGSIFVITNAKNTAYALYGSTKNATSYYCQASDGSSKTSTNIITDIDGLAKTPICK